MDKVRLISLFHRYLNGSCSREEETELMEFIAQRNDDQIKTLIEKVWNNPQHTLPAEAAVRIVDNILATQPAELPLSSRKNHGWLKVAAAISLISIAGLGAYSLTVKTETPVQNTLIAEQQPVHQFIKLEDGSTVHLNEGSTLKYPETFDGHSTREVELTGEAYFDIAHDPSRPFIVRTGKLSTTVLGTAFNVKAYADQDDITVTVTRGKVSVSNDKSLLGIITPDQQITFHKNTEAVKQLPVKSSEVVAWGEKDIFFDDVSMQEAMRELNERFSASIGFENEVIKDCRFTATFVKGEDLEQILEVICAFNQTKYSKDEAGNIIIYGAGCATLNSN